ncbi:11526_t:CDS:2, partial [Entrophospora sp. SA101]
MTSSNYSGQPSSFEIEEQDGTRFSWNVFPASRLDATRIVLGFMTEDMLYEQEQLLEKLETSERAKLQSAHLKSDMQAFKAANPHAILEDFIRWHSPKDWIPDDSGDPNKGKLSPRMMAEGNLWQELWMSAKRVPVKRQKPIFKYNGEAEK